MRRSERSSISSAQLSSAAYSSGIRCRSVAQRHVRQSSWPSNSPSLMPVLPTSIASSTSVASRSAQRSGRLLDRGELQHFVQAAGTVAEEVERHVLEAQLL